VYLTLSAQLYEAPSVFSVRRTKTHLIILPYSVEIYRTVQPPLYYLFEKIKANKNVDIKFSCAWHVSGKTFISIKILESQII
jgi:hypothetical protein